jgi:hypothetical protein
VSKKTISISCRELFGLAENCPEFCPVTETFSCIDFIITFQILGGEIITSCVLVEGLSIEEKENECKRRKIKAK